MGVVRMYVYRFPHITYPYSTCIISFLVAASLLLCSFLNVFSFLIMLFLCNIANVMCDVSRKLQLTLCAIIYSVIEISLLHV